MTLRQQPFLQVALNGSRSRADHPAVPITAQELAQDVLTLSRLGVTAVHLHVRDDQGRESLEPGVVAATLQAIRAVCPDVELAVSTAEDIAATPNERRRLVSAWTVWPDTLCVNLSEEGIDDVIALAALREVACEAGLFTPQDIRHLRGLCGVRWRRLLLEPQSDDPAEAQSQLAALLEELGTPWLEVPHVIHAMNEATWPLLRRAALLTRASRIGFEDTLTLEDGTPAHDNSELYSVALSLMAGVR